MVLCNSCCGRVFSGGEIDKSAGRAKEMSAMALGQAVAGMSLLSSSGSKQAGLLDAASGLRRCKADCVRLAAFTAPLLHSQRLKLG